ncbi:hypothetical protein ACLK19_16720 [Escherichia coli]
MRLIRERRDYYWNWSEDEGWQSQFDSKSIGLKMNKLWIFRRMKLVRSVSPSERGRLSSGSQSAE